MSKKILAAPQFFLANVEVCGRIGFRTKSRNGTVESQPRKGRHVPPNPPADSGPPCCIPPAARCHAAHTVRSSSTLATTTAPQTASAGPRFRSLSKACSFISRVCDRTKTVNPAPSLFCPLCARSAPFDSPARQCRVGVEIEQSPVRDGRGLSRALLSPDTRPEFFSANLTAVLSDFRGQKLLDN
jgi:hypothetical protein